LKVESTEQTAVAIVCSRDVRDSKTQVQIPTKNFLEEVNTLSLRKFLSQRGYEGVYTTKYTSHNVLHT
jgi:hypothetical protein